MDNEDLIDRVMSLLASDLLEEASKLILGEIDRRLAAIKEPVEPPEGGWRDRICTCYRNTSFRPSDHAVYCPRYEAKI